MTVRLALAGTGLFGEEHMRVIAGLEGVKLACVADINAKAAEGAAQRHGAPDWGTDIVPLLDQCKPDGLIVATPGQTHVPLATAALARGIPVLVEKPMAMTAAEAQSLVEAEKRGAGFVLPGHVLRFSGPHRQIADIIGAGEIGRVLSLSARRYRDDSHAVRYPDIDPIMMTMIHDIDLALWLSGALADEVLALRNPAGSQRSQTLVTARDRNGAQWSLMTAWTFALDGCPPDRLEIVGEKGGIDFETGAYLRQYGAKIRESDLRGAPDDSLTNEVAYFADCIRQARRPDRVTPADAHRGLLVAEAALASLQQNKVVQLPR